MNKTKITRQGKPTKKTQTQMRMSQEKTKTRMSQVAGRAQAQIKTRTRVGVGVGRVVTRIVTVMIVIKIQKPRIVKAPKKTQKNPSNSN